MSARTYNRFRDELTSLFYDYSIDYAVFSEIGVKLLNRAFKHREISQQEYLSLLDTYEAMHSSLAFAFLEECDEEN